jgi:hypothetical protein
VRKKRRSHSSLATEAELGAKRTEKEEEREREWTKANITEEGERGWDLREKERRKNKRKKKSERKKKSGRKKKDWRCGKRVGLWWERS